MDLCRRAARLALGRERLQEIESLPLPQSLKNYLQYQWLTPAESTGITRTHIRPLESLKDGSTKEINLRMQRANAGWKNIHSESTQALQKVDL